MDYFDYSYKHNYIEFSSNIYRVGTYHYNWHGETEILILLKGQMEMSCNGETFTMEPLDVVIISPNSMIQILAPINLYCVQIIVLVTINFLQHYGIMQL